MVAAPCFWKMATGPAGALGGQAAGHPWVVHVTSRHQNMCAWLLHLGFRTTWGVPTTDDHVKLYRHFIDIIFHFSIGFGVRSFASLYSRDL